jgi:hypothetical protein
MSKHVALKYICLLLKLVVFDGTCSPLLHAWEFLAYREFLTSEGSGMHETKEENFK